jgi:hypothetical protein
MAMNTENGTPMPTVAEATTFAFPVIQLAKAKYPNGACVIVRRQLDSEAIEDADRFVSDRFEELGLSAAQFEQYCEHGHVVLYIRDRDAAKVLFEALCSGVALSVLLVADGEIIDVNPTPEF